MKIKINKALAFGVLCCLSSCTDNFREYNTNQHEALDQSLDYDNLRVGGFIPQMQLDVIPASDKDANQYQRAQNLAGDVYSGYMGAIGTWNSGSNGTTYNFTYAEWNNYAFMVGFTKVMPAWKQIVALTKNKNPSTYALAQILKIAAMHRVSDIYGPLPYFKFGHGGITTPYDAQEDIYMSFFEDLNEAIRLLTDYVEKNPGAKPLKKFDLVYEGDFCKWLKFANSLKLRLALRIAYVNKDLAYQYAKEAIESGVLTNNADNTVLKSGNGISVFHPIKKCWDDYGDVRMGANMESFLIGYKDNRISKYFRESTIIGGGYHGVRNGILIRDKSKYEPLSVPNIEETTPIQWMCASEVYFLRAEGALRGWEKEMGGTAKELYEAGIASSFEQWGANIGTYLSDNESKPAPFIDEVSNYSILEGNKHLSTITIAWNETDVPIKKLEKIITQKWIAMYPDGQEAWTEFRRTGFPKIFPVTRNSSRGTVDTELQVRRITFPVSEYNNNQTEVQNAASLLSTGKDTGGVRLWWDVENKSEVN